MDLLELLEKLSLTEAPAGFEELAAKLAGELLAPYVDEVSVDVMGSLTGIKRCGQENAARVMLDAHIDEVGFIITGHDGGFLRFAALGGIDARIMPASTVKVLSDPPMYGVIDVLPPHVLSGDESDKAIKLSDLYIDVGLTEEEAKKRVAVGTPAVYASKPVRLGDKLLAGKSFDDRASLAAIVRALELLGDTKLPFDLYILASTQEELGRRGAQPAAYAARPDYCIILDVDHGATPDAKPHEGKPLGDGPVIARGPNMSRDLTDRIIAVADENGIPYNVSVEPGDSGTNAKVIQTVRAGVATALIGIPLRYMHSQSETLNLDDVENTAKLVCEALKGGVFDA